MFDDRGCNFETLGISQKQYRLLLQMIHYFQAKRIFTDDENIQKSLQITHKNCLIETEISLGAESKKYDLIFLNNVLQAENSVSFLKNMHNDSVLIINNIHIKKNKPVWHKLISHEQTTACIDVFTQGYIFIRNEQKKELFFIKV